MGGKIITNLLNEVRHFLKIVNFISRNVVLLMVLILLFIIHGCSTIEISRKNLQNIFISGINYSWQTITRNNLVASFSECICHHKF